jgi:branched-chain amino acid transport system permease protein
LYLLAYAAVFLLIMLFLPRGIIPSIADRRFARSRKTRLDVASTGTPGTSAPGQLEQPVAS